MAHPVSNITVKSGANAGNQVGKRDVTLVDQSMKTIKLTLWDENVHLVNEHDTDAPVIAVKGAKVSDFGGRSLSLTRNSMVQNLRQKFINIKTSFEMNSEHTSHITHTHTHTQHELNPDLPAAHALKGWYVNQGKHANFASVCSILPSAIPSASPFHFHLFLSLYISIFLLSRSVSLATLFSSPAIPWCPCPQCAIHVHR